MSVASVLTFARTRMDALGYTEWDDGFNYENIPETLLDRAYHVEFGRVTQVQLDQNCVVLTVPHTVRVFLRGGADPQTKIDEATALGDTMIAAFLKASNRLTQSTLRSISFDELLILPVSGSNDNSLIVQASFTALVVVSTV